MVINNQHGIEFLFDQISQLASEKSRTLASQGGALMRFYFIITRASKTGFER